MSWTTSNHQNWGLLLTHFCHLQIKFIEVLWLSQDLLHLVPPHRKWVFLSVFVVSVSTGSCSFWKNITHNSSPFWQGSPFRQEISKKIEMSWNIQGIRIVFFKRLRFASRLSGCWWAHLCPVSDCHRGRPELQYELGKHIQCSICWEKYESQQDQQVGKAKHSKTLALNLLCWSFAKHYAFFFCAKHCWIVALLKVHPTGHVLNGTREPFEGRFQVVNHMLSALLLCKSRALSNLETYKFFQTPWNRCPHQHLLRKGLGNVVQTPTRSPHSRLKISGPINSAKTLLSKMGW